MRKAAADSLRCTRRYNRPAQKGGKLKLDCARKMKQLSALAFGLTVAFATGAAWSQDKIGDAVAGAAKAEMCIGCHGIQRYQTNFPEVYKVPKIGGQSAKYIVSALTAYQKDERKHPSMRAISQSLTEQDMADLAAFYSLQGKGGEAKEPVKLAKVPEPATAVAELIKKGACISCHGEGFRKPIDPSYPKIAGQYSDYLTAALKAVQGRSRVFRPRQRDHGRHRQTVFERRTAPHRRVREHDRQRTENPRGEPVPLTAPPHTVHPARCESKKAAGVSPRRLFCCLLSKNLLNRQRLAFSARTRAGQRQTARVVRPRSGARHRVRPALRRVWLV